MYNLKETLKKKGLSTREIEVAELTIKGLSNKEVANQLLVKEKTVKFHLSKIYKKTGHKSRSKLMISVLNEINFFNTGDNK